MVFVDLIVVPRHYTRTAYFTWRGHGSFKTRGP